MSRTFGWCATWLAAVSWLVIPAETISPAFAQQSQTPPAATPVSAPASEAAPADQTPAPLSEDELAVLVARIALYPDDLIAVITASSLFPLQIVEANRFLEAKKKDDKLKPKDTWDGSVISLLNYPDVVKMMSDDLDWTQTLGQAITYQQKDVLVAIQQLRDQAVAKGAIKTDDKITVVNEGDNVIIRPTDPEKIYIPQYPPQMLYEPGYAYQPVTYYNQPYSNYWYPGATFFAAAVTGAAWAAAVNWGNWGVWGGNWRGNIDVDCNNCFNNRNFNGKVNWNDIDWKNVDRSKLNIDRSQMANIDRSTIQNNLQANNANNLRNRGSEINRNRGGAGTGFPARSDRAADVRKSTAEGLKNRGGGAGQAGLNRPGGGGGIDRPGGGGGGANRPGAGGGGIDRPGGGGGGAGANRPNAAQRPNSGKLGGKADNRGGASALGNPGSGRSQVDASRRGAQSRSNAQRGGGGGRPQTNHGGGGGRPIPRGGGGGGGRR